MNKQQQEQPKNQLTQEEYYELLSAFGKGETIVNVLTGEVIKL